MLNISKIIGKFIKNSSQRELDRLRLTIEKINAYEPKIKEMPSESFPAKTAEFKSKIKNGMSVDELLPEAFACVREAARRTLNERHFDTQLISGIVLHQGKISEQKTGEGKTLAATLPVYLNALLEKGVHIVTVNDFLATRDAEWMGQVYNFLGLSVGCITNEMDDADRKFNYTRDITYGTNSEFGFDYLRDNMKHSLKEMVQRDHFFCIVDEVDSILIDEARTPLVISGATEDKSDQYFVCNKFIKELYNKKTDTFYGKRQIYTNLETLGKVKQSAKINKDNKSALTYEHKDYKIVEFNTKANTLDYDSMDALKKASDKNMIIINEGMQFSAGVNLNYVMDFAKEKNWKAIEKFIHHFQMTCKQLKYSNNVVVSAPSGLALGGGFEVLVQSDYVVAHTNIVTGLVETLVGLIPAGGGTTNMLWRWMQTQEAKKDPDFAPQKVFDIIGYGKTANSPTEAIPFKFLLEKDKSIMNRNKLLSVSQDLINEKKNGYKPPKKPIFKLSGSQVKDKMFQTLENLFREKKILEHGMEVGKKLAFVLSGGNTTLDKELSEEDMYALELEAFMQLMQMEKTQARIKHTLSTGKPLVN